MMRRGARGAWGIVAVLAAGLVPVTTATAAPADCYMELCDPGATVTTSPVLFDPSGMDTAISNATDNFSGDIFNNGAGTVNEFFVNADPELGLGYANAIEDIFTSPWGDFTFVFPDNFMPLEVLAMG